MKTYTWKIVFTCCLIFLISIGSTIVSAEEGINITDDPPTVDISPQETFSFSSSGAESPTPTLEITQVQTVTDTPTAEVTPVVEISPAGTLTEIQTEKPSGFQLNESVEPMSGSSLNTMNNPHGSDTNTIDSVIDIDDQWFIGHPDRILNTGIYNLLVDNFTSSGNGFNIWGSGVTLNGKGHMLTGNGSGAGIYVYDSSLSNIIINNLILVNWMVGISSSASNSVISNVTTRNNEASGIQADGSGNTFSNITSNNNLVGILSMGDSNVFSEIIANSNDITGIDSFGSGNTFSNITSSNNGQYGILSYRSNNVFSNITSNNNGRDGIFIWYGNSNKLLNSTIQNNGQYGININFSSSNNTIIHNLFKNNGNSPSDNVNVDEFSSNIWNDTTDGNYYGYYGLGFSETCNDNDRNGICDDPYIIDTNNVDYKPLTTRTVAPNPTNQINTNHNFFSETPGSYESGSPDEPSDTQPYSGKLTFSVVPGSAQPGQSVQLSFTYLNDGEFGWSAYDKVGLLVQLKDSNGNIVETIIIPIPKGITIEPGQSYTFLGDFPMPSVPGTYTLTATLEHMGGNTPLTFGQPFQQTITVREGGKIINSFNNPTVISTIVRLTPAPVSLYSPTRYPKVTPYMKTSTTNMTSVAESPIIETP